MALTVNGQHRAGLTCGASALLISFRSPEVVYEAAVQLLSTPGDGATCLWDTL